MPQPPANNLKNNKPNVIGASLNRSNTTLASNLFSTKANNDAKILPINKIVPDKQQPRRSFDEEKLQELAEDIKAHGILQPPIVRKVEVPGTNGAKPEVMYQLVVGERRYRAALLAGLKEMPVIIGEYDDQQAAVVSLVENLQREDLDVEDEALYFKRLIEEHKLSYRQIGKLINKNHLYVYKRLKLLERPDLLGQVRDGKLNLNLAIEMIRDEAGTDELIENSESGSKHEGRFPGKQSSLAGNNQKANQAFAGSWKKFSQFTSYLKVTIPKIEVKDENEKEGLKQTIMEIEEQLAELKKKLGS